MVDIFNLFNYVFSQVELQIDWSQTQSTDSPLPWVSLLFQMYTEYKEDGLKEQRHTCNTVLLQALLPNQDHDLGLEEHAPKHRKTEKYPNRIKREWVKNMYYSIFCTVALVLFST